MLEQTQTKTQTQTIKQPTELTSQPNTSQPSGKAQVDPTLRQGAVKRVVKIPLPDILRKKMRMNDSEKAWEPITLEQFKKDKAAAAPTDKKLNAIAREFVLPKPKNSDGFKPKPNHFPSRMLPKPLIDLKKPSEDQVKWDIEDQSFIVKEFEKINHNPNLRERFEEQLPQINQEDLPEDFKGRKITNVSKESLVDADWERKAKQKKMRLTLWEGATEAIASVSGKGREKNQINALLEDAMKRAEEIDFEMGKKSSERKAMKNRYGW